VAAQSGPATARELCNCLWLRPLMAMLLLVLLPLPAHLLLAGAAPALLPHSWRGRQAGATCCQQVAGGCSAADCAQAPRGVAASWPGMLLLLLLVKLRREGGWARVRRGRRSQDGTPHRLAIIAVQASVGARRRSHSPGRSSLWQ
jgi:hypothetical protein